MFGYFVIVCIANLALGFALGRFGGLRGFTRATGSRGIATGETETRTTPTSPRASGRAEDPAKVRPDMRASSGRRVAADSPAAVEELFDTQDKPSWNPASWDEFGNTVEAMESKIDYVRSLGDAHLARQLAAQLTKVVEEWQAEVERHAADGVGSAEGQLDPTAAELCLAQFETTLSNLRMCETDADVDALLDRLEKESQVLMKTQQRALEQLGIELVATDTK